MKKFLNAINNMPHPEEARSAVSKDAGRLSNGNCDTTKEELQDMKVFVTGGSGLVGSTVIDRLLGRGDTVLAIDNFVTGRRDNLAPHPRLRLLEDSIVDAAVVDRLGRDLRPDGMVHTVA